MNETILLLLIAVSALGAFLAFPAFRVAVAIWFIVGVALIAWFKTQDWQSVLLAGGAVFIAFKAFAAFSSLRAAVGILYALGVVMIILIMAYIEDTSANFQAICIPSAQAV